VHIYCLIDWLITAGLTVCILSLKLCLQVPYDATNDAISYCSRDALVAKA